MKSEHKNRILELKKEWASYELLDSLYGIQKEDATLWGSFRAWSMRFKRQREVIRPDEVNRYAFETYLQQLGILPIKIAASHLGMTKDSLMEVLGALQVVDIDVKSQAVSESFLRSIRDYFPKLRHKIFGDHDGYRRLLHATLKKDLGITIEGLFCITSQTLKEDPPDYAYEFDSITGEPVGLRYQVWLDFKKPIHLKPDACSLKFYVENKNALKPFLMLGRKPEIPSSLKKISAR